MKSCRKYPEAQKPHLHFYCNFRLFARPEVYLTPLLILIQCRWCALEFCLCRRCWRGQVYCCDQCRQAAKLLNHCKAQQKYRQSDKGKKAHRQAENRRRYRKKHHQQKKMDDATSLPCCKWAMVIPTGLKKATMHTHGRVFCQFCGISGQIVGAFPRRGYG